MKLSKSFYNFCFNLLVAILITLVMSFVLTLFNLGYSKDFWRLAFKAYGVGLVVAVPTTLAVIPLVRKIMDWVGAEQ